MIRFLRFFAKWLLFPFFYVFRHKTKKPQKAQEKVLHQIVQRLKDTSYGSHYQIVGNENYDDFKKKIPIVIYEDLNSWIERQKQGEQALLSKPVLIYEKTSGSSGSAKYIPYTQDLKRSFGRMFLYWMHDLFSRGPHFQFGRVFMSISPAFQTETQTSQGVKIGFDEDTDYLPRPAQLLMKSLLNCPPGLKQIQDPITYKLLLSCYLVADETLEIISIWNPTYLTSLLAFIVKNRELILESLQAKELLYNNERIKLPEISAAQIKILKREPINWLEIWPHLKLISCWTDGSAVVFIDTIREQFPTILIQGKGLLATEAPMTFPLLGVRGGVPLLDEIFFEFENEQGDLLLLHELKLGDKYNVIITQKSGLIRYRMGDQVKVVSHFEQTPCLNFLGRTTQICDIVGEKLNEIFVREKLSNILSESCEFWFLVPVVNVPNDIFYLCLMDTKTGAPIKNAQKFEERIDKELQEAFHYRNARLLGQLKGVQAQYCENLSDHYYGFFNSLGMKWGDIKYSALITQRSHGERILKYLENIIGSG